MMNTLSRRQRLNDATDVDVELCNAFSAETG